MLAPADFFDLTAYAHRELFEDTRVIYVWDVLKLLREYLERAIQPEIQGEVMPGAYLTGDRIFIGAGSVVEPGALVKGPAYIGRNTQVRHGAYVRERVLVGDNCVVGHATEIKDTILLDGAHAAHFAYLGDSILGNHVNLGAGTRLANLKLDNSTVKVRLAGDIYDTGMRKLGAIVGDRVQTGCNTVTNPGTLLAPDCRVYALTSPRGYYPRGTIVRSTARVETAVLQASATEV
jgi:UDP-N-acetylglucosamine diphosphorylase / glucose-1-phosphate thymidylyltransferase / UDP-N-acetylgalactosamine diphosphorylase / glucosamine-1-phosphate N-acetyltransferase / galactosamine-1-phosphate N-acetyltransferase